VNYNVEVGCLWSYRLCWESDFVQGQQYACTVALQALTNVPNYLKVQKIDIAKVRCELSLPSYLYADLYQLTETYSVENVKEMLGDVVTKCFDRAKAQQMSKGYIKLERGFATIPLPGIDVPFHSRYLWAGVMPFRACTCNVFLPDALLTNFRRPF
jgi:fatty acid synthase subunit alpha, fungi type